MKTSLELLETQLHDEEATQSRKAVRFYFAAEAGGGGTSMAVAAQTSEKLPCFFAVAYHCLKVKLVDDDGRPVKQCPMLAQDRCFRPHEAAACKKAYADSEVFNK
jgi:hypothetical protein